MLSLFVWPDVAALVNSAAVTGCVVVFDASMWVCVAISPGDDFDLELDDVVSVSHVVNDLGLPDVPSGDRKDSDKKNDKTEEHFFFG